MSKYESFKKFLSSISKENISEENLYEHIEATKHHNLFVQAYKENKCYLCGLSLDNFDLSKVCLHWLLNPKGFDKRYFPLVYQEYAYTNIQSFLRWCANQERFLGNINDLVEEMDSNKIIDNTIKYKNLEWSFSCAVSDFQGHQDKFIGKTPHYHFQMRINKRPFIKYGEFHIPLTENDIMILNSIKDESSNIEHRFAYGEGMQDLLTKVRPEDIVNHSTPTDDEGKATIHLQTLVEAEPGKTISGEDIYKIFQESKEKNVTISSLAHKLGAKSTTFIEPAPSVPEIAHRTKRKRGKSSAS
jgi:hypothetical protein